MAYNSQVEQIAPIPLPIADSVVDNPDNWNGSASDNHKEPVTTQDEITPVAALAGKYAEEPLWDELLKSIEEYNQETNLREGKSR